MGIKLQISEHYKSYSSQLREYLSLELCEFVVNNYDKKVIQDDGRIKYWAYIKQYDKYLRVVIDNDGETIITAFFDRGFKR